MSYLEVMQRLFMTRYPLISESMRINNFSPQRRRDAEKLFLSVPAPLREIMLLKFTYLETFHGDRSPLYDKIKQDKQMIAKRAAEMTSFIVMDVLEKAHEMERQGIDIIHLEVGEPDFDTPQCIKDAAEKALKDGFTHYTHSLGILELREAICEYYANTYRVSIDPGQIIITSGTSPAMFMLFSTILEENDEVIISDPHYACFILSYSGDLSP